MKPTRRAFLGASAALAACTPAAPVAEPPIADAPDIPAAVAAGARWLWAQQDPGGAFPSRTFGVLSAGQSLTPFVLLALSEVPPALHPFPAEAAGRALAAALGMVDDAGALGFAAAAPDYPVYATAMLVSAIARISPSALPKHTPPLLRWLGTQQYGEGWADHPALGGFGMGARVLPTPPDAGHVDLSMTRRALEAFAAAGQPGPGQALAFLARAQVDEGGFLYSPVDMALNKGGHADGRYRGYGSATCDGVLALLACGVTADDPRVQRALAFLHRVHRVDRNPGVDPQMSAFAQAMRGYYRAGAAAVFARLGGPEGWRPAMAAAIVAEQRPDGAWENPSALQKESDPLIATALALKALTKCLS
ncbi:MAG: terpene cyclase/mutase family protein [Alphaproteobacteria bacterium]|nr:terpene cyclase/mutase family protein [Alphaproteobacteria bacterium]